MTFAPAPPLFSLEHRLLTMASSSQAAPGERAASDGGGDDLGMFDHVVVLDEILRCPHGHRVDGFQTKSFDDPAMGTYLIVGPEVQRVAGGASSDADDAPEERWTLEGGEAVFQRRHAVESVAPPRELVFYATCEACPPVLVRSDRAYAWGDLVDERRLWVEFRATFDRGGPRQIERTSGTRDDLVAELREEGLRVIREDEPLAIAHREIRAARDAGASRRRRPQTTRYRRPLQR